MKNRSFRAVPFLLPALLIYLAVIIIPAFYSLYLSFFKWNGVAAQKIFVGFGNYLDLFFKDTVFLMAIRNNVLWTLLSLVFTSTTALGFAMLLNRQFRGRTIFRGLFYFPYILSGIVVALMWSWIYHPQLGFLNSLLGGVGLSRLERGWLSEPGIAFFAVFVAALWQSLGAPMVLYLAGLQTIPQEMQESARIDGANPLQAFFHITIPLLKETFVIVLATTLISSMKVFDIVFAMTGGGPAQTTQTLATWMYFQTFNFANIGTGTAISWILVLVVMIITVPYVLYMARD